MKIYPFLLCSISAFRIQKVSGGKCNLLGKLWKTRNTDAISVIDSLPVAVCDNMRIRRAKIYSQEDFRGYQASKKRYVYGLTIHLMVTKDGQPVECFLTPGGCGDVDALQY
jgi:Transposase DDE domain